MLRLSLDQIIHEPGSIFTIMVAFALGFLASSRGNPLAQIGLLCLAVMHLLYKDATLLGKFWMWAIIGGFVVHKFGLSYGAMALVNGIRERFKAAAHDGRSNSSQNVHEPEPVRSQSAAPPYGSSQDRDASYERSQEEYARRQQQRNEEARKRANAKRQQAQESREKAEQDTEEFFKEAFRRAQKKKAQQKKSSPPPEDPPPKPEKPKQHRAWWEILGVSATAPLPEIKKAWRARAKQFHSDNIQHMSETFKKEAEEEMKVINQAYEEGKKRRK